MTATAPGCVTHPAVFQNPVLEEGAPARTPEQQALRSHAAALCAECPLAAQCLYDAVVRHEVSGFVAGTTATQRRQLRGRLGLQLESENFDAAAGVTAGGRPVDRDEVLRLRRVNPDETLDQLAMRLGCSTSTVKRHLRSVRRGENVQVQRALPSRAEVLTAARSLFGREVRTAA